MVVHTSTTPENQEELARTLDAADAKWRASPDPWDTDSRQWQAYKAARRAYCVILQNLLDEYEQRSDAADEAMRRFRDPNRRARKSYTRRMVEEAQAKYTALNSDDAATGREVVESWYALKRAEIDRDLAALPLHPKRQSAGSHETFKHWAAPVALEPMIFE